METYYIYHIPGVKVGCTDDLKRRTVTNKTKYGYDIQVILLATTTDLYEADELENEWSIKLGFGEIWCQNRYVVRSKVGKRRLGVKTSKETREKQSKAKKGKVRSEYHCKRLSEGLKGRIIEGEWKEKIVQAVRNRPTTVYIEKTTGFIGKPFQMQERFGVDRNQVCQQAKRDKPYSKGRHKGLHFAIYNQNT
jgi:hypothetical protein